MRIVSPVPCTLGVEVRVMGHIRAASEIGSDENGMIGGRRVGARLVWTGVGRARSEVMVMDVAGCLIGNEGNMVGDRGRLLSKERFKER